MVKRRIISLGNRRMATALYYARKKRLVKQIASSLFGYFLSDYVESGYMEN